MTYDKTRLDKWKNAQEYSKYSITHLGRQGHSRLSLFRDTFFGPLRVPNHDAAQQEHEVPKHPIVPMNFVVPSLWHALVIHMVERRPKESGEHFVNILDTDELQLIPSMTCWPEYLREGGKHLSTNYRARKKMNHSAGAYLIPTTCVVSWTLQHTHSSRLGRGLVAHGEHCAFAVLDGGAR